MDVALNQMSHASPAPRKLRHFDGLRGVMASIVCAAHWQHIFNYPRSEFFQSIGRTPLAVLFDGRLAVVIFFILSGRVLAVGLLRSGTLHEKLPSAFIRRPFRLLLPILPAAFFGLVLFRLGCYHITDPASFESPWWNAVFPPDNVQYTIWSTVKGVLGLAILEGPKSVSFAFPGKVIWTIPDEFRCSYFIYGLAAIIICTPKKSQIRLAGFVAVWHLWQGSHAAEFSLGFLLALLREHDMLPTSLSMRTKTCLAILMLALYTHAARNLSVFSWMPSFGDTRTYLDIYGNLNTYMCVPAEDLMKTIVAMCAVWIIEIDASAQKLFSSRWATFLGRVSFSLYLIHSLIQGALAAAMLNARTSFYPGMTQTTFELLTLPVFVISFAFILYLSWYYTIYVDDKSIQMASWVSNVVLQKHSATEIPSEGTLAMRSQPYISEPAMGVLAIFHGLGVAIWKNFSMKRNHAYGRVRDDEYGLAYVNGHSTSTLSAQIPTTELSEAA